jgi:hypothetical protein
MPETIHHQGIQFKPPARPGLVCLQTQFGSDWQQYENRAIALGFPITHVMHWVYVTDAHKRELIQSVDDQKRKCRESVAIGPDWVSDRHLFTALQFNASTFSELAGLPTKKPTGENELFTRLDDLPEILETACKSRRYDVRLTKMVKAAGGVAGLAEHLAAMIHNGGLAGLTERMALRRKPAPRPSPAIETTTLRKPGERDPWFGLQPVERRGYTMLEVTPFNRPIVEKVIRDEGGAPSTAFYFGHDYWRFPDRLCEAIKDAVIKAESDSRA